MWNLAFGLYSRSFQQVASSAPLHVHVEDADLVSIKLPESEFLAALTEHHAQSGFLNVTGACIVKPTDDSLALADLLAARFEGVK